MTQLIECLFSMQKAWGLWWHMPIVLVLRRGRQEKHKFEVIFSYILFEAGLGYETHTHTPHGVGSDKHKLYFPRCIL